jgi:hypothetical protein
VTDKHCCCSIVRFSFDDRITSDFIFDAGNTAAVTRLVLPSGAPMSTRTFSFFFIHAIHASIPAFICSGLDFAII